MDVTIVVATFGDQSWVELAKERAIPSVAPFDVPVIAVHDDTLHDARNTGMRMVETEWVCFLDADDELEPDFFDAIDRSTADLRAPSVRYVTPDREKAAWMPQVAGHLHACRPECLAQGNWLVIGTVAPTALVRSVGGFRDFPVYEDWDLWLRCYHAGASIEACPDAVYRAHVRPDSRNRGPAPDMKHATHQAIAAANGVPVPA